MSDNWIPQAKLLAQKHEVFLLDMRNHGNSPHSEKHSYKAMSEDIFLFLKENNLSEINILGHSMGGKTAMQFAFDYPEKIKKLIVADISPKEYSFSDKKFSSYINHYEIMRCMYKINFENIENRKQIENILEKTISDKRIINLLLKNVKRSKDNKFSWRLNISALLRNFKQLFSEVGKQTTKSNIETLFIKGELSPYIFKDDIPEIDKKFNNYKIIAIPETGHWLHSEKPDKFIETVNKFLSF